MGGDDGFRAPNLPCSGNGDAALAPKPAAYGALCGSDSTFLCLEVWLAMLLDEFELASAFRGPASLRQRSPPTTRDDRRYVLPPKMAAQSIEIQLIQIATNG